MRLALRSALIGLLLCACSSKPAIPPPAAPAGLTATGGAGQVALAWTAVNGAGSYDVLRGDAAGAETAVATSPAPAFTDTGLAAGQTYFYVVQAVGKGGKSGKSNEASAVTAPPAPANLTVTTTDTSATVAWSAAPGATAYDVLRAPGGSTTFAPVGTTSATSAADSGLTPNTGYLYAVRARNAAGTSADVTVNATTAPVAPTGLTASASNHHVALGWTAATGAGAGGYRVLRATSAAGPFASAGTTSGTSFTDTFLANNTQYFYVVHTVGGSGESGDSNQATATPFIEICTVDAASYAVSVFDGMASGNAAPKRSFGWSTGIAEGTGIGTDGTNIFIASKFTQTVNVYPRATVSGDQAPSRTISLPGQPTGLTVSGTEVYVGIGNKIHVFKTTDSGAATATRTLTLPANVGTVSGVTGIQVFSGTTSASGSPVTVNQTFVVADNKILVYNNGDSGTTAPQATITPAGTDQFTRLVGPAYDPVDDAIFVGWFDRFALAPQIGLYARVDGTTNPKWNPIVQGGDPGFSGNPVPGGIVLDGNNLWVVSGGSGVSNSALLLFPRTGTGPAAPTAGFFGPKTRIYKPGPLVLDAGGELWFINGRNGAEAFPKSSTTIDSVPVHALTGEATGLYDPVNLAADRARQEIVVLNQSFWNADPLLWGNGHGLNVYPASSAGTVTPARTIAGPNTTLDAAIETRVTVDEANGEYWVDDHSSNNGFMAFAASPGGNVAPARNIIRDLGLGNVGSIAYDAVAGQILTTATTGTNAWTLSGWNRTDSGNVPADRSATATTPVLGLPVIDYVRDELFIFTDNNVMSAYSRAFPSGPLTAIRTIDASAVPPRLEAIDAEGGELYFRMPDSVVVAPRPAGAAFSVGRTISGSATRLYNTVGLAICN